MPMILQEVLGAMRCKQLCVCVCVSAYVGRSAKAFNGHKSTLD